MQLSLFTLLSAATLAVANFDLYTSTEIIYNGENSSGWHIFQNDPNCNDVLHARHYWDKDDVSGSKVGVRCKGTCGGGQRADGIEQLEMHFSNNPLYHFTIYKNSGYKMYGLDGKVYGECILFPGNDYTCSWLIEGDSGTRKFRCLTHLTAAQIQGAR